MPSALSKANIGEQPDALVVGDTEYPRVRHLRYGDNPPQHAALYNPDSFLGSLEQLRVGKQGASQTNMEDILYAALTVGYFYAPSVDIMKHENPSGFATQYEQEPLALTYRKACDADFRAAFGGTVFINRPVDRETAEAIKELFTEVLVAPGFEEGVVDSFKGSIRIFEYNEDALRKIPKYTGDEYTTIVKTLPDSSIIRTAPFLSPIRTVDDLRPFISGRGRSPTDDELRDLLTGYRIRLRSNSVRMVKNGYTTALGTGQQDRVMCIDIAAYKNRKLEELAQKEGRQRAADYAIEGSVLVSDGFFPFTDSIELAQELGITAVLAPHGGKEIDNVLDKAADFGIAYVDLSEDMRFFDHH